VLRGDKTSRIAVDPEKIPYDHNGLPGSLLDVLLGASIDIDHSCGGVTACSTCHVYVEEGLDSCNEASEDEEDMLDNAPAIKTCSRLACQCVPDGSHDVVLRIPQWNRNQVRESHH
jgi:2Fe-2S ferredoxin